MFFFVVCVHVCEGLGHPHEFLAVIRLCPCRPRLQPALVAAAARGSFLESLRGGGNFDFEFWDGSVAGSVCDRDEVVTLSIMWIC